MQDQDNSLDLLYGVPAIAEFIGLSQDKVYHLHKKKTIPTFKIDGKVCARKSTLKDWLSAKEKAAQQA